MKRIPIKASFPAKWGSKCTKIIEWMAQGAGLRAQGAGHRAQSMEHGAWGMARKIRIRFHSSRQGDKGKWGQGEEQTYIHSMGHGAWARLEILGIDSIAADKGTRRNGDKEKNKLIYIAWAGSMEHGQKY